MANVAIVLIFCEGTIAIVLIFGYLCLCTYLRKLPEIKHSTKADLKENAYKTETELKNSSNK